MSYTDKVKFSALFNKKMECLQTRSSLVTCGGCCSDVALFYSENGTPKCGRYSELVVSSGLTIWTRKYGKTMN